jgi:hypothetical protein
MSKIAPAVVEEPCVTPTIDDNYSEHVVDIKVHAQASILLDHDHNKALDMKLREVTDEQLLAEVSRRNIDVHHSVSLDMVKKAYDFTKVYISHKFNYY